jgi:four helix bundle protein
MVNIQKSPVDLRDRTLIFSRDVIRFLKIIRKDEISRPIITQLTKSATSIGANFVEAKNGSSKKDFRNKVFISKKEASETLYWLQLMEEFIDEPDMLTLKQLQKECQELILILQKIVNTLGG